MVVGAFVCLAAGASPAPSSASSSANSSAKQKLDVAVLQSMRVRNAPQYTRVVLEANAALNHRIFTARGGKQIGIELYNLDATTQFDLNEVNLAGSRISGLSYAKRRFARRRGAGQVARRLLLKTSVALRAEAFLLDPVPPYGHRFVIDLYPIDDEKNTTEASPTSTGKRAVIIAIDAGHGGKDPGAVGAGGILEAEVVLQLARRIAAQLEATPGLSALLIRDGDYYVPKQERMQKARASRADLFISVHADAFKDPKVAGASVFALSSGGASSELARWLAAKESRSDLIGGVAGSVKLRDKDETLARVILDLSLEAQMNASLHLADAIRAALADKVELHRSGVEQASFEVLKSPDIPSVLVETGFLSNPAEARRLAQGEYQARLATAVANGIVAYVRRNPPPGSHLAAVQTQAQAHRERTQDKTDSQQRTATRKRQHVISAGETLSTLAEFYGITTGQLRQANHLAGDRIRVGQVLLIPGAL